MRVEIGPRDVKENQVVVVRRHNGDKQVLKVAEEFGKNVKDTLEDVHQAMFKK